MTSVQGFQCMQSACIERYVQDMLYGKKKTLKGSRFNINKDIVWYKLQKRVPLLMYKQMKLLLH